MSGLIVLLSVRSMFKCALISFFSPYACIKNDITGMYYHYAATWIIFLLMGDVIHTMVVFNLPLVVVSIVSSLYGGVQRYI